MPPASTQLGPSPLPYAAAPAAMRLPVRANLALLATVAAANAAALFALPALAAPAPLSFAVLLLFVLLTPMQWGLIHEAIHGHLLPGPANRAAGRVLSVLLGYAFDVVRFGHLLHHTKTGQDFARPDCPAPGTASWQAALSHYGHLLGGQYLVSVLCAVPAFLPWTQAQRLLTRVEGEGAASFRDSSLRWFGKPQRRAAVRADALAAVAVLAASFWLYGAAWPWLAAALFGRGVMVSLLDNMPHYATPVGGGNEAVLAFRLPRWPAVAVMNHHLHRTHHHRPNLPWTEVPAEHARTDGRHNGPYLAGVLRQFLGPMRG